MSILFINGSPNKNGNTVRLTKKFLKDQEFKTLNLVDYKIYSYGQNFEDDQLDEVIESNETSRYNCYWFTTLLA